MNNELETIKKNYTIKISFLDEQDNEVTSVNTSTDFVQDMYAMHGSFALRELYNTAIKYLKERELPDHVEYETKRILETTTLNLKPIPLTKEEIKHLFPAAYQQHYGAAHG
jgi:hypothetical protein